MTPMSALVNRERRREVPALTFNPPIKLNTSLKLQRGLPALRCSAQQPRGGNARQGSPLGNQSQANGRTAVCAESFLRSHYFSLSRRAQKQEPRLITAAPALGIPLHGAGGTCGHRWAPIRVPSTTSPGRGLTTAQMLVVHPLALSSFGGTTSARLLATKMVIG